MAEPAACAGSTIVTRYYDCLAEAAGVSRPVAQKLLATICEMAAEELRTKRIFYFRGIATFYNRLTKARPARLQQIQGLTTKARPKPERRRVTCLILKKIERVAVSEVAAPLPKPGSKTKEAALNQEFARQLASRAEVFPDVTNNLIGGLQAVIIRELREKGSFVLEGLTRFYRADAKARPMSYSNLDETKLCKGRKAQKRVFSCVP